MCSVSRAHEEEEKSCIGREKFIDLYNRDCCLLLLLCCRAITISLQTRDPDTICIPKYNNRIFLHLLRGETMCYPEDWMNNNECPRKYPQKLIRQKTAQTLHFQWSIILWTKLPLPPHRLELRNKQVRGREREKERWGNAHILRDFDSAFDELLPAAPQHLHTHRLLRNPHPEIFLKSLLLQTTTKLTNPVHE